MFKFTEKYPQMLVKHRLQTIYFQNGNKLNSLTMNRHEISAEFSRNTRLLALHLLFECLSNLHTHFSLLTQRKLFILPTVVYMCA